MLTQDEVKSYIHVGSSIKMQTLKISQYIACIDPQYKPNSDEINIHTYDGFEFEYTADPDIRYLVIAHFSARNLPDTFITFPYRYLYTDDTEWKREIASELHRKQNAQRVKDKLAQHRQEELVKQRELRLLETLKAKYEPKTKIIIDLLP